MSCRSGNVDEEHAKLDVCVFFFSPHTRGTLSWYIDVQTLALDCPRGFGHV